MITITSTTITEYGISSVAAKTTPLESSNTRNTIDHLLNQIQTWQHSHHEQQQLHENHPPSSPSTSPRRPFVTATFAQSIDGYMSPFVPYQEMDTAEAKYKNSTEQCTQTHSNYPLSCPESFVLTHGLRSIHDGILIGGRTLLLDNPRLTNRLWGNRNHSDSTKRILPSSIYHYQHQPQPIIIDPNLRYITQLLNTTTSNGVMNVQHSIVCCTDHAASSNQLHQYSYFQVQDQEQGHHGLYFRNSITNSTIRLLPCQCHSTQSHNDTTIAFNITDVFHQLYHQYHIRSIMVEGGATTLSTLFASRMVDAIVITIAPLFFGHGIRPRFRPFVDPNRKQTNHFDSLRLIPSSTSFVLLGKDTTFIAQCDRS